MSTTKTELHLSMCGCPHVNIGVAEPGGENLHFACDADQAEKIARDLMELAAECRAKRSERMKH